MALLETELSDGSIANIKAGSYLGTDGTLVFLSTDAADDGLFLRINESGGVVGYRAVNQDLEWKATDTTNMSVAKNTWMTILSLTVDHDVTTANGSFVFYASVDQTQSNRDVNITIQVKADGTTIGTPPMIVVDKGDLGRPINIFGAVTDVVASGATVTIEFWSTEDIKLRGDVSPTTLKVIEAQAAPVTQMFQVNDDFGNAISRAEIESVLAGYNVTFVKDDFTCFIIDVNQTCWFVKYIAKIDKFAVKKMVLK